MAMVSKRSTVNEPRMATPPIATGIENSSALAMLAVTSELIAASIGTVPPTWAVTPLEARLAGVSSAWIAW